LGALRRENRVAHPDMDRVAVAGKAPEDDAMIPAALDQHKHGFDEWPVPVDAEPARSVAVLAKERGVAHIVRLQSYHAPSAIS
jgi:hypothetical protein